MGASYSPQQIGFLRLLPMPRWQFVSATGLQGRSLQALLDKQLAYWDGLTLRPTPKAQAILERRVKIEERKANKKGKKRGKANRTAT